MPRSTALIAHYRQGQTPWSAGIGLWVHSVLGHSKTAGQSGGTAGHSPLMTRGRWPAGDGIDMAALYRMADFTAIVPEDAPLAGDMGRAVP